MFHKEPLSNRNDGCQDRCDVIIREIARLETWLAVDELNARRGETGIGAMLSQVKQHPATLRASARGL